MPFQLLKHGNIFELYNICAVFVSFNVPMPIRACSIGIVGMILLMTSINITLVLVCGRALHQICPSKWKTKYIFISEKALPLDSGSI